MWLASYPRSGNTLLRIVLRRAFGLESWSIYDDQADIGVRPMVADAVGHRNLGQTPASFIAEARERAELTLVKTHELPADDARAICVVRDGRSAIVSYAHYLARVAAKPTPLEVVTLGAVWPGSWSDHVRAWALSDRPGTLVVRYEALAALDPATLSAIGAHLGRAPIAGADIDFGPLHALYPDFFRSGSDLANIAELDARCPAFYAALHGETAMRLGYGDGLVAPDHSRLAGEWRRFGHVAL